MNPLSNFKVEYFVKLGASVLSCFNIHWYFQREDPSGLQQKDCFYTPQFSIACTQTYHCTERTPFASTTYLSISIFNFVVVSIIAKKWQRNTNTKTKMITKTKTITEILPTFFRWPILLKPHEQLCRTIDQLCI